MDKWFRAGRHCMLFWSSMVFYWSRCRVLGWARMEWVNICFKPNWFSSWCVGDGMVESMLRIMESSNILVLGKWVTFKELVVGLVVQGVGILVAIILGSKRLRSRIGGCSWGVVGCKAFQCIRMGRSLGVWIGSVRVHWLRCYPITWNWYWWFILVRVVRCCIGIGGSMVYRMRRFHMVVIFWGRGCHIMIWTSSWSLSLLIVIL